MDIRNAARNYTQLYAEFCAAAQARDALQEDATVCELIVADEREECAAIALAVSLERLLEFRKHGY